MNHHFGNISSDSDQWVAPARLYVGHWRHPMHAHGEPVLCQVVIDAAEPRLVAAQVAEHGVAREADRRMLHTLDKVLRAQDVYDQPSAWGFTPCTVLPAWVRPTFSESQIEELQRIQGYLIEAPEHKVDTVLRGLDEVALDALELFNLAFAEGGAHPGGQHGAGGEA
ncbi:MAG: hypothetical protein E6Q30_05075, partial [Aquabacterium sp.]